MNQLKVCYRFEVLFFFVLLETLMFEGNVVLQTLIAILEYIFLLVVALKNLRIGILYFCSFTLLTFGWGNYFDIDLPNNFWGLRIGSFSVNILFSAFLALLCLIKNKGNIVFLKNKIHLFFLCFIIYSAIVGFLNVLYGINYIDNFINDLLTYFPFFLYIIFLAELNNIQLITLLRNVIILSVISLIFSYIFNKKSIYAENYFLLSTAIYLILPVLILLTKKLYSYALWMILIFIIYSFIVLGEYFISGKVIILYLMLLCWLCWYYKKLRYLLLFPIICILLNIPVILRFFMEFFSENIISYKFSQIYDVVINFDLHSLAILPSSISNLIAEGLTIFYFQKEHLFYLLFGGGFGFGVPDVFGYLTPWAGASGYAEIDLVRNNFFKMHLPIYEVTLKGGYIFLFPYILILIDTLKSRNIYLFTFGLLFFLSFYVTKEMLLLTLILLQIAYLSSTNNSSSGKSLRYTPDLSKEI